MRTKVRVNYNDGSVDQIDMSHVIQYSTYGERAGEMAREINPGFKGEGTGCQIDYLIDSLIRKKPIVISIRDGGKNLSDIMKVINPLNVKSFEVLW